VFKTSKANACFKNQTTWKVAMEQTPPNNKNFHSTHVFASYFPTRKGIIQLGPKHISIVGHLSIIVFPSYSPYSKSFLKGRGNRPFQVALGCTPIHKDQSMW
jgi:hypothetical protein